MDYEKAKELPLLATGLVPDGYYGHMAEVEWRYDGQAGRTIIIHATGCHDSGLASQSSLGEAERQLRRVAEGRGWLVRRNGPSKHLSALEVRQVLESRRNWYENIAQVKEANRAAGGHWFEPGAMRFFRSRIGRTVHGGRYFISSEQFQASNGECWPRAYTVREAKPDGSVETVGAFQAYETRSAALAAIKRLLRAEESADAITPEEEERSIRRTMEGERC